MRAVALLVVLVGAGATRAEKPGVVFIVGGVGGIDPLRTTAGLVLPRAGVPHEIRDFYWNHGVGRVLRDVQDTRHVLRQARLLADQVRAYQDAHPGCPVYLVGHSAGTGLVVSALEQLPTSSVERAVLLSSALSPDYDLRPALRALRRELVSYHSCVDRIWLDLGTSLFGTVDRVYTSAAGADGFRVPSALCREDRELYARLVQIAWKPEKMLDCHVGFHGSTTMPGFVHRHLAPWLRPER